MKKRFIILFLLLFYGAGFNDAFAQYNPPDTSQLVYHAPALAQIICSFDYTSSEIVITPCTYTGMVSVTVTNIDTGAIALFTMANLCSGFEIIPFVDMPGIYLAEIETLSGSGRKYYLMFSQ